MSFVALVTATHYVLPAGRFATMRALHTTPGRPKMQSGRVRHAILHPANPVWPHKCQGTPTWKPAVACRLLRQKQELSTDLAHALRFSEHQADPKVSNTPTSYPHNHAPHLAAHPPHARSLPHLSNAYLVPPSTIASVLMRTATTLLTNNPRPLPQHRLRQTAKRPPAPAPASERVT